MDHATLTARLDAIRAAKDCTLKLAPFVTPAFRSIPPHRVGIAHLAVRPRFLLADPVGTGKTPMTLAAYAWLRHRDPTIRLHVTTLKSTVDQWRQEAERFLSGLTIEVIGGRKSSIKRLGETYNWRGVSENSPEVSSFATDNNNTEMNRRAHQYHTSTADILITTWDRMVRDLPAIQNNPKMGHIVQVYDEIAEKARNWKQETFWPVAQALSREAHCCWGITATPQVTRNLDNFYSIWEIIWPGFFGSYSEFRRTYYQLELKTLRLRGGRIKRFYEVLGYQHLDQLARLTKPYLLKRPASEFSAYLPKLRFKILQTEMGDAQQKVYDQIIDKYFPDPAAPGGARKIDPIVSLGYAQMASDSPEAVGQKGSSAKLDELMRFLQEEAGDDKVIVFTKYTKVLALIKARVTKAKIGFTQISGQESGPEREKAKAAFFSDPAIRVLGLTSAGGAALNLQAARIVVLVDLPWGWGTFVQILGRSRRLSSTYPEVLAVLLMNTGTIDTETFKVVIAAQGIADRIMGRDDTDIRIPDKLLEELDLTEKLPDERSESHELSHRDQLIVSSHIIDVPENNSVVRSLYETLRVSSSFR